VAWERIQSNDVGINLGYELLFQGFCEVVTKKVDRNLAT
jgi:hypothetical protein